MLLIIISINGLVYKIMENGVKCRSVFPKAQDDILKSLEVADVKCSTLGVSSSSSKHILID